MKTLLLLVLIIFFATPALAIDWPQIPVVGIIGSSYDTEASPFGPFIGAGYIDGEAALAAQRRSPHEFAILNAAQGGSFVDPVTNGPFEWIGYQAQFDQIIQGTVWAPSFGDGISRLAALFIGPPNNFLHTQPFSVPGVYDYVNKIKAIIDQSPVPVFIPAYPPWADADGDKGLNMQKAALVFQLPDPITRGNYLTLAQIHEQELKGYPNVIYLDMYADMENLGDWLHPNTRSQDRAAAILYHELFRVLELNK